MIGPRVGLRVGGRQGPAVGVGADPLGKQGLVGVDQDATSQIYVPSDATQWGVVLAAAGLSNLPPANLWLMQEAAGDFVDAIGAIDLTVGGADLTRQNVVAGWSRFGAGSADGSQGQAAQNLVGGVNLATTSYMLLLYVKMTATPAAQRPVMGLGAGADHRYAAITEDPLYMARDLSGVSFQAGVANPGTAVRPVILQVNRATSKHRVYTDQEIIETTWINPVLGGSAIVIGDALGAGAPPARYLYVAGFSGAGAELSSTAIRAVYVALGWTVAW